MIDPYGRELLAYYLSVTSKLPPGEPFPDAFSLNKATGTHAFDWRDSESTRERSREIAGAILAALELDGVTLRLQSRAVRHEVQTLATRPAELAYDPVFQDMDHETKQGSSEQINPDIE